MINNRAEKVYLVLEDGSFYQGLAFGADKKQYGEVVFNTSMTGYQEVLTDPSYAGQLVVMSYPLVGNYGIYSNHNESDAVQVAGFIVRDYCLTPSNGESDKTLGDYLGEHDIPGIYGIDTRAVIRRIRNHGVMMGVVTREKPSRALLQWDEVGSYGEIDFVKKVTTDLGYAWRGDAERDDNSKGYRIIVVDYGLKYNILRLLKARNCEVIVMSANSSVMEILDKKPDGILLSPGPGDPALLDRMVSNVAQLIGKIPMFGICLGHQIIAQALGAKTYKLKFGHRGGNHPVSDLTTGKTYITAQNHGYAVDPESLPQGLEITHVNLNDGTVEGLRHIQKSVFTIQYHSEGSPGPKDNEYLFDEFMETIRKQRYFSEEV